MESTKSDVQENQKSIINAKKDSKAAKALVCFLHFLLRSHQSVL